MFIGICACVYCTQQCMHMYMHVDTCTTWCIYTCTYLERMHYTQTTAYTLSLCAQLHHTKLNTYTQTRTLFSNCTLYLYSFHWRKASSQSQSQQCCLPNSKSYEQGEAVHTHCIPPSVATLILPHWEVLVITLINKMQQILHGWNFFGIHYSTSLFYTVTVPVILILISSIPILRSNRIWCIWIHYLYHNYRHWNIPLLVWELKPWSTLSQIHPMN